ncbi:MAG: hypothetical protein JXQ23_11970 [Clostridia bacterium]|nr:hypothetical protein [Clostridia bacterium]
MRNKKMIIAAIAISLLLVGGVAMAGYNGNGNTNLYQSTLADRVESGDITQAEADAFYQLYEELCEENNELMQRFNNTNNSKRGLFMNSEAMAEYTAKLQVKIDEVFQGLVNDGILTQAQVDSLNPFERGAGFNVEGALGDLTDEQCDAVEAAMADVHEYMGELKSDLSEAGIIGSNPRMTLDGSNKGGGVKGRRN